MGKAFGKDILRSIRRSFSRFVSIIAIVFLGAGVFAGLAATSPNMKNAGDRYYDAARMMDIRLISTLGFTEEDLEAIRKTDGVEAIMPSYSMDAMAQREDKKYAIRIHALPEHRDEADEAYLNRPILAEGHWPRSSGEAVLVRKLRDTEGIGIGDVFTLQDRDGTLEEWLAAREFTIVGLIDSPYYMSFNYGTTSLGSGNLEYVIYVPESDFLPDLYPEVYLTVEGAESLNTFSADYEERIKTVRRELEQTATARTEQRYREILEQAREQLNQAKDEYNRRKAEVEAQLAEARAQLEDSRAQIEAGEQAWLAGRRQLDVSRQQLEERKAMLEQMRQMPQPVADEAFIRQVAAEIARAEQELSAAERELAGQRERLAQAREELAKAERELEAKQAEAEAQLAEAAEKLAAGEADIRNLKPPKWYILDRQANEGFAMFQSDAERMNSLSSVFPVIFFLVAALVALTTMTRMVDEERTIIGTYKALGYSDGVIAWKYLSYAAVASLIGSVLGTLVGFRLLPIVIWNTYGIIYSLPPLETGFYSKIAVVSVFISVLCILLATGAACYSTMREVPAGLMRPKAPKPGKRVFLETIKPVWKRLSFSQKVTVRNLFLHKRRLVMTVVGIAGCTSLLVTGFGIKDSLRVFSQEQFGNIFRYHVMIGLEQHEVPPEAAKLLHDPELIRDSIRTLRKISEAGNASNPDQSLPAYLVVPEEADRLNDFITFRERMGHKPVFFGSQSVVITEKLSNDLGIRPGDKVTVKWTDSEDEERYTLTVTGVTENYAYNYVYVSTDVYEEVFGGKPEFNVLLAKTTEDPDKQQQLADQLLNMEGISTVGFQEDIIRVFDESMDSLDKVVLILIVCAGLLAFIVLYNLTNINVGERERELATIKVLGFYDKEVNAYIYRETIALTVIGCVLGLVAGHYLFQVVIQTVEIDIMMMGRKVYPLSYVWSALLTLLFSGIVNLVMSRRIRRIDMIESLKSVD